MPESALAGLSDGNAATITFPGLPGETFSGVIDKIYPEVDMQTRTARVRVDLSNPEGRLLVNMFADVALATGDGAPVVQVPETAVIDTGDRQVVIRDLGNSLRRMWCWGGRQLGWWKSLKALWRATALSPPLPF